MANLYARFGVLVAVEIHLRNGQLTRHSDIVFVRERERERERVFTLIALVVIATARVPCVPVCTVP